MVNAIKYSPPSQTVNINVHCDTSREQSHGVLEVIDRGPGIDVEVLPTLFDPFVRGPNSSGLGLGLHLAQHIARAHDGQLDAESKPGEGTKFRLAIPSDTVHCQPPPA